MQTARPKSRALPAATPIAVASVTQGARPKTRPPSPPQQLLPESAAASGRSAWQRRLDIRRATLKNLLESSDQKEAEDDHDALFGSRELGRQRASGSASVEDLGRLRAGGVADASFGVGGVAEANFAVGEEVRYWSSTYAKWVRTHVQQIHLNELGVAVAYDLTHRAQAEVSRVRDATYPEHAPGPDARVSGTVGSSQATGARTEVQKSPRGHPFSEGELVQYFSETKGFWVDALVEAVHRAEDGGINYDLSCKKGVPAERIQDRQLTYLVGEAVEYWSSSSHAWVPAKVEALRLETKSCDLSIKPNAMLNRVRKLRAPPPNFQVGDRVRYCSDTKKRLVDTIVMRVFYVNGALHYDLKCKGAVPGSKVQASLRPRRKEGIFPATSSAAAGSGSGNHGLDGKNSASKKQRQKQRRFLKLRDEGSGTEKQASSSRRSDLQRKSQHSRRAAEESGKVRCRRRVRKKRLPEDSPRGLITNGSDARMLSEEELPSDADPIDVLIKQAQQAALLGEEANP
eukprot:TRINITY_DN28589_c0_g1_i2.p1 TRINITY_DN28589_c0_g1~~TRINITY_DN28589_c0_g1_i2.p1  ORF type:complete len:515 (+),score=102.44 TRINITY_DN28589_c0_g1_i2:21-1565(+)